MHDVAGLFRAHAGFVERALRRAGVAERDLGDATQEVFVVVHRRLPEFEGRACVTTWLYRIAWNVASEHRRRAFRKHERLEPEALEHSRDVRPGAGELLERRELTHALLDAIDKLDADKREALVLHELHERPMREVASELRIPLKTAFSRVYAARRALAGELRRGGHVAAGSWLVAFRPLREWSIATPASLPLTAAGSSMAPALAGVLCAALLVMPDARTSISRPRAASTLEPSPQLATHASNEAKQHPSPAQADAPASADATASLAAHELAPARAARPRTSHGTRRSIEAPSPSPSPSASPTDRLASLELSIVFAGVEQDGPFGESPLASPPLVAPQRHPRARLPRSVLE